jgi:toxin HigB-1
VKFRFSERKLQELYESGKGKDQYPDEIVNLFLRRVRTIEGVTDERELRALKSLHFEKLKGRKNQYSIRLNKHWRLLLTFEKDREGKIMVIIEVNNHYE